MDVYCHTRGDVDRQCPLRRHSRADVAEKVYPARLRIFHFQSRSLFRSYADLSAGAASLDRSSVVCLGQRLQFIQYRHLLGIHDRSVHRRAGQASLRLHRRRWIARRRARGLHYDPLCPRHWASQPSGGFRDHVRNCWLLSTILPERFHR